jgi:hypothetical protein
MTRSDFTKRLKSSYANISNQPFYCPRYLTVSIYYIRICVDRAIYTCYLGKENRCQIPTLRKGRPPIHLQELNNVLA